jgi:hypothetical protein
MKQRLFLRWSIITLESVGRRSFALHVKQSNEIELSEVKKPFGRWLPLVLTRQLNRHVTRLNHWSLNTDFRGHGYSSTGNFVPLLRT